MSEKESILKKELAQAQAEIADLKLQLRNSTLLLKIELTASGKLPKREDLERHRASAAPPRPR